MNKEKMLKIAKWGVLLLYVFLVIGLGKKYLFLTLGLMPLIMLIVYERAVLFASLIVFILYCLIIVFITVVEYCPSTICEDAKGLLQLSIIMPFYNLFVISFCLRQNKEKKYFLKKFLNFIWILFFLIFSSIAIVMLISEHCKLFSFWG